jgi:lipoate-protein ligase A
VWCFLPSTEPHHNLAVEEFLLPRIKDIGPTFLMYVNSDCVVMGKHQNPWLECHPNLLAAQNIPLLRRFTGGGTVFHDLGNLNFSFLMPREEYNEARHFGVLQGALADLGLESTVDAHKSMWINGKKFSGSAFARKLVGNVHHGTLLIKSNLSRLEEAIRPELPDLKTKAPRSRRATVTNLVSLQADLTVERVVESLRHKFAQEFLGHGGQLVPFWTEHDLLEHVEKHRSWNWVFGSTPEY